MTIHITVHHGGFNILFSTVEMPMPPRVGELLSFSMDAVTFPSLSRWRELSYDLSESYFLVEEVRYLIDDEETVTAHVLARYKDLYE